MENARQRPGAKRGDIVRYILILFVTLVSIGSGHPLQAAAGELVDEHYTLDIPSSEVDAALIALARKTGRSLIIPSEGIGEQRSAALKGSYTLSKALSAMLKGTNFSGGLTESGVITIWLRNNNGQGQENDMSGKDKDLKKSLLASVAAFLLFGSSSAVADQGEAASEEEVIDEIVVVVGARERGYRSETQSAAMFGDQSILDTPFQVSVFPIELLQDQQVRTLFHVSKNDASTVVSDGSTGFYDALDIRGFRLDNSNGYHREGLAFINQVQIPFENKAAVEIVKGVSALRYGFTSPGGIVNYVLKRPTEQPYRYVDVFGNSHGGYGTHIDLGGKISENIGVRMNTVVEREALHTDGGTGRRKMISMIATWEPTDRLLMEFDAEYSHREAVIGGFMGMHTFSSSLSDDDIHDIINRFDPGTLIGEPWTKYPTRSFVGAVRASYEFAPGWKIRTNFLRDDLHRTQTQFYTVADSLTADGDYGVFLYYSPDQHYNTSSIQGEVTGEFSTGNISHSVVAGVLNTDLARRNSNAPFFGQIGTKNIFDPSIHLDNPYPAVPAGYLRFAEDQRAFFASDYMQVTDWLNVFAGVRYTKPHYKSYLNGPGTPPSSTYEESAVTPSGGIILKPTPNISIYTSYAEGLEPGGTAPIGTQNASQALTPLKSRQYEVGVKAEIFEAATLSAALFRIDKPLELINADNVYVQDGRQVHQGLEVSLAGQVTNDLRMVTSAQYLDAEQERTAGGALDGLRPIGVPKLQLSSYASWRFPMERQDLSANFGAFYSSEKFANSANTFAVDSFTRFDAGLRYGFSLGDADATLRLVVENLTDENYISGTVFGFLLYGPSRTVRMSLSASF